MKRYITPRTGLVGAVLSLVVGLAAPTVIFYEGLSTKAYLDPVGIPTICYGETENVYLGQVKSKPECDQMLRIKLGYIAMRVYVLVDTPMTAERLAGLTSFTYNVGLSKFRSSSLLRRINASDPNACDELLRWTYARGKQLPGLVKRRNAERNLCLQ